MIRNIILVLLSTLLTQAVVAAPPVTDFTAENLQTWPQYEELMAQHERENEKLGWSYIISGGLVTLGSLVGSNSTSDSALQLVLGLTTTSGLAGMSYGIIQLNNGPNNSTLFETLRRSKMSYPERAAFLQEYLRVEKEKLRYQDRVKMITHLVAAGLNLYSAAAVDNQDSKSVLYVFAALNVAFAFSYSF